MTRYEQTIKAMERHLAGEGELSSVEVETALQLLATQRQNIESYQRQVYGR